MASEILELAQRLGRAIHDSPQAQNLHAARKELDQHKDLTETLRQYQEQLKKVQELEDQNKPVEVPDKHKLKELSERLVADEVFKRYTAAQVEYVDLMRQVNTSLRKELAETEEQ